MKPAAKNLLLLGLEWQLYDQTEAGWGCEYEEKG
jgi:hypothetical protein